MIMKKQKRNWLLSNVDQRDDDNSQTCHGTYPVFTLVNDA